MGYYTSYRLETVPEVNGLISELRGECENAAYAIEDDGEPSDTCKWYEHKEDMIRISSKYPDVLFVLSGEGEESGDIWREYYKDGKSQRAEAKITFDAYDPDKLA